MIYFITDKTHYTHDTANIQTLTSEDGIFRLMEYLETVTISCLDLETTGLEPLIDKTLLLAVGDENIQFVIDLTTGIDLSFLTGVNITWMGHNIKFDYSMLVHNHDVELMLMYDTMIAHQRIFQNTGIPSSLDYLISSYLGIVVSKEIRETFIGMTANTKFNNKQIEYVATDIKYLFAIKERQAERIEKYNMYHLLYNIEFPLIKVLADMESEGFIIDQERWTRILEANEEQAFELECKMDEEMRHLRDTLLVDHKMRKLMLTAGQWDRKRNKRPILMQQNLFGGEDKVIIKKNTANINYGSPKQIQHIFETLMLELPSKDGHDYLLPSEGDVTTGAPEMEAYMIERPNSPANKFIRLMVKYRECKKEISTYGETFLNKINIKTGKLHTIFRQCSTANSRLASGGGKKQTNRINIQNIPAKIERRECFGTDIDYKIITCDLSGAEVTIMASHAQDFKLLELTGTDIHSHMAQAGWRNIYMYRLGKALDLWGYPKEFWKRKDNFDKDGLESLITNAVQYEYWNKAHTFIVSKTVNKELRRSGKNLTFGAVYGARSKKAGKTINVSQEEGQIYLDTIKYEIPGTFKLVESNVKKAVKDGYLVLNERTNSRIWFPVALDAKKTGRHIAFGDMRDIDGPARNIPISGTQADMLKEAMVEIHRHFNKHKMNAMIIGQVHDEILVKVHKSIAKRTGEYVKETMCNVANRYLNGVEMDAEYEIKNTWTK